MCVVCDCQIAQVHVEKAIKRKLMYKVVCPRSVSYGLPLQPNVHHAFFNGRSLCYRLCIYFVL